MKISTKVILPLILISALSILFAGCFTVPTDESPGFTPGTITGTIAAPCCSTSAGPVTEPQGVPPEYWCYYCKNTWSLQEGVKVVLAYGLDKIATTTTDKDGKYTFTNVPPAKNYVITAYCPDYDDDRPLVKDVALKVVEGKTYDAKITDCVSTALGLVVDYLVENTTVLGPEEIVLDGVIAGIPNFYGFPEFKKLVERICEIAPGCVDLFEDEKVPDYLCRAAQEIGRKVIPDLDLGCVGGYTPGPGPGPTPATTYKVFYNGNGNTGGTAPTDANNYIAGATVTVLGPGILVRTNYTFSHWDTQADDNGTNYNPTDTFSMPAANVTLYAQWQEDAQYTVTYNANGGTGSQTDPNSPYYVGATVTVLGQGTIARTNYTFNGWNTAANGTGTAYDPADTFTMPASNVVLYAQWLKLDPLMSPVDVVPGQEQIRINLRDANNNLVPNLDNKNDWYVELTVADSDATIVSVQYGGHNIGPWDFQIRVKNIPTGTELRNVTVIYNGYGYPLVLHQAY